MNKRFYLRLALTNIKNNRSIYLPYLMAGTLIVTLFYGLRSVMFMLTESGAKGGGQMSIILMLSSWICGMLSLVVLFYINSFIMKRRKKEFGLYSVLGMNKRHIALVVLWEVILTGALSVLCGILLGALFSQLLFLLLLGIVHLPAALVFQIPLSEVVTTVLLFGAGFVLLLVYDVISIGRTDPIALLRSSKEGEREPKSKWGVALVGLIALGTGYWLSWTVRTPSDAITVFFPAVLLVIIGTYCLFIAGSIVLLKLLRGNKSFYYKPENFVAVSGMMHRMKQNAVGLANICILATCVLVTLSSTVSLFIGEEDILREKYPREVMTSCIITEENSDEILERAVADHAAKYGLSIQNPVSYRKLHYPAQRDGNALGGVGLYDNTTYEMNALVLDDYNRLTGTQMTLAPGEILMAWGDLPPWEGSVMLEGQAYSVRESIPFPSAVESIEMGQSVLVVVPEYADLELLQARVQDTVGSEFHIWYEYNHDVAGEVPDDYYSTMREDLLQTVDRLAYVSNLHDTRNDFYQIYGSLLFVGIFFITLFLTAAVLIVYYKQITEGFDDHDRFRIMQNVGMSDREVRTTIGKQVLMVFFLPLGMAVVHIFVAFPVLCKLLEGFEMTNRTLFLFCTIGAVVAFAVLYFVVYQLTSKTYYRIVQVK